MALWSIHTDVAHALIHFIDVPLGFVEKLARQVNAIEMTLLLSLRCNCGHLAIKSFISVQRVVSIRLSSLLSFVLDSVGSQLGKRRTHGHLLQIHRLPRTSQLRQDVVPVLIRMVLGSFVVGRHERRLLSETWLLHFQVTCQQTVVMALDPVCVAHYDAAVLGSQVYGIMLLLHFAVHFCF